MFSHVQLLRPHGRSTRPLCPWISPRQGYWSGLPFLLQGIFPTQRLNLRFLHWQVSSLLLSHQGSPPEYSLIPVSASNLHDFLLPRNQISAPSLVFHACSCHSEPPVHPSLSPSQRQALSPAFPQPTWLSQKLYSSSPPSPNQLTVLYVPH